MGFRVEGFDQFRVESLGFRVQGSGVDLGFPPRAALRARMRSLGSPGKALEFRV